MLANQFKKFIRRLSCGLVKPARRRARIRRFGASDSEKLENRQLLSAITVTSIADNTSSGDGQTTLREALIQANADPDHDTISFDTALFSGNTISLTGSALPITSSLTIEGPGARNLQINGSTLSSIFDIRTDNVGDTVEISGLSLRNAGNGAAVLNDGADLLLRELSIRDNLGNGVHNISPSLTRGDGDVTIIGSTIADNAETGVMNEVGELSVERSTISGNDRGIFSPGNGTVSVKSSTIAFNSVTELGSGAGVSTGGAAIIQNTILAGNTGLSLQQIGGRIIRGVPPIRTNANVLGNATLQFSLDLSSGQASNVISDTLADNGGPTDTFAIASDSSPAIDQGNSFGGLLDQRGHQRTVNFAAAPDATGGDGTDIGAVEFGSQEAIRLAIVATDAEGLEGTGGTSTRTFTVTRSGRTTGSASVNYRVETVSGNSASASDFAEGVLPSGVLTFADGETSKQISIGVAGDTAIESDEDFQVRIFNATNGAVVSSSIASGVILNDDIDAPSLSITSVSMVKAEGNSAQTPFSFTISRDGNISRPGTVDWAVTGSGLNPADADDFGGAFPSGTVSFAAGESLKTVTGSWSGDLDFELDESFTVTLSNASNGATIDTATTSGLIQNDDVQPPENPLLSFSYVFVNGSGQLIGANDSLGPGDEFRLLVFAREDVAATPGGIGSLILDIDFDETLVETVGYSADVIDNSTWSTELTQTAIGSENGDLFVDDLGAFTAASLGKPGDGVDVLFAAIPFRVKESIDVQTAAAANFVGRANTSSGLASDFVVNSLNTGSTVSGQETDFGTASLLIQPFDRFDLNRDGNVNTADLSAMRGQLLQKFNDGNHNIPSHYDLNRDGRNDTGDLSAMRGHLLGLLSGNQSARPALPVIDEGASILPVFSQALFTNGGLELAQPDQVQTWEGPQLLPVIEHGGLADMTTVDLEDQNTASARDMHADGVDVIDGVFTRLEIESALNGLG